LAVALYKYGKREEALAILGRGLHGLQDIIAHGEWPFFLRHPAWFDSAEKARRIKTNRSSNKRISGAVS
jgi:hypothetical protein